VKQNFTVELFHSDQWNAVPVSARSSITPVRGLRNEAGGPVPSSCSLSLDAREDSYNPYDPASAVYGLVGRNTPIRIGWEPQATTGSWADARAAFAATVASGWAAADVGGAWTLVGVGGTVQASDWSQSGGQGRMYVPVDAGYRFSYLDDLEIEDCEQAVTFTCPLASGANLEPANLTFRGTSSSSYVLVRAGATTSNSIGLFVYSSAGASLGSANAAGVTYDGKTMRLKARVTARDIWVKCWDLAGSEPDWQLHVVDPALPIPGHVGIRCGRASGNTNTTDPQFTLDDYELTVNVARFVGEVASWKPGRSVIDPLVTPGRGDRWCDIEAAGIMRRLSQRASPLRSALYRGLSVDADVVAYWPLEEGASATTLAEVRGGGSAGKFSSVTLGADAGDLVGAASVASFSSTGLMTLPVRSSLSEWAVTFEVRFPTTPGGYSNFARVETVDQEWFLDIDGTSFTFEVYDNASGSLLDTFTSAYGAGAEPPNWLAIQLHAVQSGGNINWEVKWNPVGTGTFYWSGVQSFADTLTKPVLIRGTGGAEPQMASVAVSSGNGLDITEVANLAVGWADELAETRMSRLCTEQGITFTLDGTAGDTPPMSGQAVKTLVSLLTEAAFADQGILYEPRSYLGFALRTTRSLYDQTPVLALDMTTEGISPPLYPLIDDLPTENDVTAKRPRGSEARSVLETGRMSIQDPPDGVGLNAVEHEAAVAADGDLPGWAQWRRHLGTVDEARYPQITVDLDAVPSMAQAASLVDVGDVITVANLDNQPTLSMLVLGIGETFGTHRRLITYVCAPGSPYIVGELDHATYGRIGSDGSTTASSFVAGTGTSLSVAVAAGYPLWETGTVDFDIQVAGVVLSVSNISGASSPQTFTVGTTVNVAKTIPSGETVRLATRAYIGL
jgi:hypothetical protein